MSSNADWHGEREWYNDRIFETYISEEEIDKQKDLIALDGLEEVMDWFVKYGVIHYKHTWINFAEPLAWKREDNAIKIKAGAHINYKGRYPLYDWIWEQVKEYYKGDVPGYMSIGGQKLDSQLKCDAFTNSCYNYIPKVGLIEASWVGASPANMGAAVTNVNLTAKASETSLEGLIEKKVEKRGDKWCVVHCSGPEAGEAIKCFDTKEQAEAMHRAIQANKSLEGDGLFELLSLAKQLTTRPQEEEHPAPKSWWDKCISYAKEQGADNPEEYCGALWYHVGPSAELKEAKQKKEVVLEGQRETKMEKEAVEEKKLEKEEPVEEIKKQEEGEPMPPEEEEAENPLAVVMRALEELKAMLSQVLEGRAPEAPMEEKAAEPSSGKPGEVKVSFKSREELKSAVAEVLQESQQVVKSTMKPTQKGGQDRRSYIDTAMEEAQSATSAREFFRR